MIVEAPDWFVPFVRYSTLFGMTAFGLMAGVYCQLAENKERAELAKKTKEEQEHKS